MTSMEAAPTGSDLDRRTFLKRAAGTMAVIAVNMAFRFDAVAQEAARGGYQFFTREEGELMEAIAGRIWPADDDGPGAIEAGAVTYVDRALSGPYAAYQQAYRVLLHDLAGQIRQRYGGSVRDLDERQLDALLGELEERSDDDDPLAGLPGRRLELGLGPDSSFDMVRTHVMEGVFCDPIYGGNRDFAGWRAVNYPGAHYVYTAEEQQVFEPLTKPYQSVADL
ncbi:gluconate 2-dehydrogenase subunit 3 family protein [soil metagenome]